MNIQNVLTKIFLIVVLVLSSANSFAEKVLIADDEYANSKLRHLADQIPEHIVTHLNNKPGGVRTLTTSLSTLKQFNIVIMYNHGDVIGQDEYNVLETYIQEGGHLIVTGLDSLKDNAWLATLVRAITVEKDKYVSSWKVASTDHTILDGVYGGFRNMSLTVAHNDHDRVLADELNGAIGLGKLFDSSFDKIIFTAVPNSGGTVGYWNGNEYGKDWIKNWHDNWAESLGLLRNWLYALSVDSDGDGRIDLNDGCPFDKNKFEPGVCGCGVSDVDNDGDGTPSCIDECPYDKNKIEVGICGCGVADDDEDGDGVLSCLEECPEDPNKTEQGLCGCGYSEVDSDGDTYPNCIDTCPNDAKKLVPGYCGCGIPDVDVDGDGSIDCADFCPNNPNKTAPGVCGCETLDTDTDHDGTPDCVDECPSDAGKQSPGVCGCGISDANNDGDVVPNCFDSCPNDGLKQTPGLCGCHVPDIDANSNGIVDCLATSELNDLVAKAKKKLRNYKKKSKKRRKKRRALNKLMKQIQAYSVEFAFDINTFNNSNNVIDMSKKSKRLVRKATRVNRGNFKKKKRRAKKSLNGLASALVIN